MKTLVNGARPSHQKAEDEKKPAHHCAGFLTDADRLAELQSGDARFCDLCVFVRLHTTDANSADTHAILHDGYTTFEETGNRRGAQERGAALVNDIFVNL